MTSLAQRAKRDPKLLKKALANPGLRSKLPASALSPRQRAQRALNTRLKQPITPGSSRTERDLAHEAQAAMAVKYGPLEQQQQRQVGEAQTWQRDIGGYYDQYMGQLQARQQAVQDIAAQTNQQLQGTLGGVTGLAGADLTQLNQAATKDAAARGATSGDLSQMASNAAGTRQALLGSFAAQQAVKDQANSIYASGLAREVAPAQKLGAVAQAAGKVRQAREKQATTAREKGAAGEQYRATERASEAKNILAGQIATGKTAADLTKANLASKTSIKTARIRAKTQLTTAQMGKAMKDADRAAKAGEPNKYGVPADQWRGMSTAQRQKTIRDFAGGKGKGGGKGPDWVTQNEAGSGLTQAGLLKGLAQKAKTGTPFIAGHQKEKPRSRYDAEKKIQEYAGDKLKSPALLRAAVDAVYDGHISAFTIKQLIAAGYKPSQVASTLGVQTSGQYKRQHGARTRANTKAYGKAAPQPQGHY